MDTLFPSHAFDKLFDPEDDLGLCTDCKCQDAPEGTKELEELPVPCLCGCHEDAEAVAGDIAYCQLIDK